MRKPLYRHSIIIIIAKHKKSTKVLICQYVLTLQQPLTMCLTSNWSSRCYLEFKISNASKLPDTSNLLGFKRGVYDSIPIRNLKTHPCPLELWSLLTSVLKPHSLRWW